MKQIEEDIYQETFDSTYKFLYLGMPDDINMAINMVLTTLETLTTYLGNDLTGRGSSAQVRLEAEIAATEVVWLELVETSKKTKNN